MKKLSFLFVFLSTSAFAIDRPIPCTGNSCKLLFETTGAGGAKVSAGNFDGTGTLNLFAPLPVASGGTAGTTQATARTGLGLGTLSTLSVVGSAQITDDSIVNADINSGAAIATSKLSGAVTSIASNGLGGLATLGSVASATISDNTIMNVDVNSAAAIATSKLSGAVSSISGNGLGTLSTINSPVPIANGGTAGTTVSAARTNLGIPMHTIWQGSSWCSSPTCSGSNTFGSNITSITLPGSTGYYTINYTGYTIVPFCQLNQFDDTGTGKGVFCSLLTAPTVTSATFHCVDDSGFAQFIRPFIQCVGS